VLALQETKCDDDTFATVMADVLPDGYEFVHHGRDHWNGVAIISRVGIDAVHIEAARGEIDRVASFTHRQIQREPLAEMAEVLDEVGGG